MNQYFDYGSNRTAMPLYVYYMKKDMVFEEGYNSTKYGKTYYDGYGYNYYYGGYGYYEYAINDKNPEDNILMGIIFGVGFMSCFTITALAVNCYYSSQQEEEERKQK